LRSATVVEHDSNVGFGEYSLGESQFEQLSGLYCRTVGHLEMIPKSALCPESVAFGNVQLD
jgi:hypothetical protein